MSDEIGSPASNIPSDAPNHFRYIGPVLPDLDAGTNEALTQFSDKRPIVAVIQDQQADVATDLPAPTLRGGAVVGPAPPRKDEGGQALA